MKTLLIILSTIISQLSTSAITVRFDDADRGPSDTLLIGGVSVSGSGQVATANGLGLGVSGVGQDYQVNAALHFLPGVDGVGEQYEEMFEDVTFQVDGDITSLSLLLFMDRYNTAGELIPHEEVGFGLLLWAGSSLTIIGFYPIPATSVAVAPSRHDSPEYNIANIHVEINDGYNPHLQFGDRTYEQRFNWGFSVLSLEYTPVPEPGTIALLGLGLLALWKFPARKR